MRARARMFGLVLAAAVPLACGKSEQGPEDAGAGPPDWVACEVNSDCVLESVACCAPCGEPELADVDAVNRAQADAHFADVCPTPVPCPKCAEGENPNLQATCAEGSCRAFDVTEEVASACASDDQCRLRATACCECGASTASWDLIAINNASDAPYAALVCDPAQACDACAPLYPPEVEAYCGANGHCAIRPASDCATACAEQGLTCCDGRCVLTSNDSLNCGGCGNTCSGATPYCGGAACMAAPCDGQACSKSETCCGSECCAPGELCCTVPGPGPSALPRCYAPSEGGTCPIGCPLCL